MRVKLDLRSTNTHFQYSKQRGYCIFKIATLFPGKENMLVILNCNYTWGKGYGYFVVKAALPSPILAKN